MKTRLAIGLFVAGLAGTVAVSALSQSTARRYDEILIRLAQRVIERLDATEVRDFRRLWYLAVVGYLHGLLHFDDARPRLARALSVFPRDAELLLARGSLAEASGVPSVAAIPTASDTIVRVPRSADRRPALESAADDYRQALAIDPQQLEARLRLGRVLLQLDRAEVLAGMPASGQEERHPMPVPRREDPGGEHARPVRGEGVAAGISARRSGPDKVQDGHAGVVVVEDLPLRRLTDQLPQRGLDHRRADP